MPFLRRLPRLRPYVCRQCTRNQQRSASSKKLIAWDDGTAGWSDDKPHQLTVWSNRAHRVRAGMEESMLHVLEQRGLVKDVAGGREALDWLLTEKPIGVYVGVDPTAPSLHVGHLLPLMALYWMYLYGYRAVTLLGGGTVKIGDPSGRTTARQTPIEDTTTLSARCMGQQLNLLWGHVNALGIRHGYSHDIMRRREVLDNRDWLRELNAVDLMRGIGSGMRLGSMLARDSVKTRMENGEGMSVAEFTYPLFQAYDWWHMYKARGVQLQIGGSDQYGNICAGIDAVEHMCRVKGRDASPSVDVLGLTTPLLTTAAGEKFGKSAGNAVWLDQDMMSSFDLYQYFLRTADDDVERYLKLFTFLPLSEISLVMSQQREDGSKRIAQHVLAKEIVSLAHGASCATRAEVQHKGAFSEGTSRFSQFVIRAALGSDARREEEIDFESFKGKIFKKEAVLSPTKAAAQERKKESKKRLQNEKMAHKMSFVASPTPAGVPGSQTGLGLVTLPLSMLGPGTFHIVLCAAGLASSNSEARRLIQNQGAYVIRPNSGTLENPTSLKWESIDIGADPKHYLVDFEALVLRSGKTKIQICQVVTDEKFEAAGLDVPGWEAFKAKRKVEGLEEAGDKTATPVPT